MKPIMITLLIPILLIPANAFIQTFHNRDPFITKVSPSSTIVDVEYEYEETPNNTTIFNVLSLPTTKLGEIQSLDLPTSYIIPIQNEFIMIDVPPYTKELHNDILSFTKKPLKYILVTNQNSVYYSNNELNDESNYYTKRVSDLENWKSVFPDLEIVMHRIDIPRDCKKYITQVLDGYGPFALQDTFVETGRPLTVIPWDDDKLQSFIEEDISEDETQEIAQKREEMEESTDIIAMYTPGHTSGSVCYIFPKLKLCASGFTVPVENKEGVRLDYKGYITTNKGGLKRQVESVDEMMNLYGEFVDVILPSRGGVYVLEDEEGMKEIMEKFVKVGEIYESLGI